MLKKEKNKKCSFLLATTFLLLTIFCCSSIALIVSAAINHNPVERVEGEQASIIKPVVQGAGSGAEVLRPEVVPEEEIKPFDPFIPDLKDDEPFIDMEAAFDFSTQYDYTNAALTCRNGASSYVDGVYTTIANSSIYANTDANTPFPYGTISADIMNNGSDSGLVFGLSADMQYFWEGSGVSYYFAFVSYEGILFLGRTVDGVWSSLTYTDIEGFETTKTYNLSVVYRVDKIVLILNGVPMLSYRTDVPLSGTGWGIRTGINGATVSNLTISNKVTLE